MTSRTAPVAPPTPLARNRDFRLLWLGEGVSVLGNSTTNGDLGDSNHVWDGYWICANPNSWNRLPNDIKAVVAKSFNEVALLERDDLAKLDRSLQGELEKKGVTFTKPDLDSFRDKLRAAGFYQEWKGKIGNEAWALLEKHVGKLA